MFCEANFASGLAHARTQISPSKKCHTRKREQHRYERHQCWMREERPKPTPTKDGKTDVRASTERDGR
jgi:hypothetical protein